MIVLFYGLLEATQTETTSIKWDGPRTGWIKDSREGKQAVLPGGKSAPIRISWRGKWPWGLCLKNWVEFTWEKNINRKGHFTITEFSHEQNQMWSWCSFAPRIPTNSHYLEKKPWILSSHFVTCVSSKWSFSSVLEGSFYAPKDYLWFFWIYILIFDILQIQLNFSWFFLHST